MGAGSIGAGLGPCGHDLVAASARVIRVLPAAVKFDPYDRTYPYNTDGTLQSMHPVFHEAAHLLGIARFSIAAVPNLGIPLAGLRRATSRTAQREAEDAAAIALKPLLDRGDIRIDAVVVPLPFRGQFFVDVTNLRDINAPSAASTRLLARG